MRIATLILALVLMAIVGMQSCAVYGLSSIAGQQKTSEGGALGLVVAFLYLVGAAFALPLPIVSVIAFALAGLFGIAAGATTPFSDMSIWGVVSFALAALSFLGHRERRRRAPAPPDGEVSRQAS